MTTILELWLVQTDVNYHHRTRQKLPKPPVPGMTYYTQRRARDFPSNWVMEALTRIR